MTLSPATPSAPSASGGRPFDAVLCDVDNVIRVYEPDHVYALERAAGLAEGTTMKVAFAPETVLPLVLGRITPDEWAGSILRGLTGLVANGTAVELSTALIRSPFHADETVVALLRRARTHMPLVLVTNTSVQLEEDLESLGLTDLADHVVSSARVGIAKPDRRIYDIAVERAGVPAERCLFVDDTLENVEAAAALGMRTVHYRTPEDLRGALNGL
ncbi:HAD family phosphatase [Streptomyces sp. RLB3-17]|uniref:HAD family hydrolase n=1 Tax=Streptomyces sp. RLB3-17 TaxID=2594455 RepID=UPI0011641E02|nr:HAD family phosphatase [Streptomyces sp. RLB3-17]QDO40541.1 HAD family phosphatase [Streptomyces sp. RLB3-17]